MFDECNYKFSVDWLNVRLTVSSPADFISSLEEKFNVSFSFRDKSVAYYKKCVFLPEAGYSSFLIGWNEDENGDYVSEFTRELNVPQGLFISISGDGCRYINTFFKGGFSEFIKFISFYNPVCTRIDMACDILDENNSIVPMIQAFSRCAYDSDGDIILNSKLRRQNGYVTINTVYDDLINDFTDNVTIGGRSSTKGTLQLYNKRVEVATGRLSEISDRYYAAYNNPDYWWRLEYRCKSFAQNIFNVLFTDGVIAAFRQAANDFGSFCINDNSYSISRCSVEISWSEFIDFLSDLVNNIHFVELISLPYVPSSVKKSYTWINNISSAFYKAYMLSLYDPDFFRDVLQDGMEKVLNENRHKAWLDDFKRTFIDSKAN